MKINKLSTKTMLVRSSMIPLSLLLFLVVVTIMFAIPDILANITSTATGIITGLLSLSGLCFFMCLPEGGKLKNGLILPIKLINFSAFSCSYMLICYGAYILCNLEAIKFPASSVNFDFATVCLISTIILWVIWIILYAKRKNK